MDKIQIENLDVSKIKVPQGYKVIIDLELVEQDRRAKEKAELEQRLSEMTEPTIEELAEFGKMYHPYYEDLRKLNEWQ
jgi:hypothetical protein